MHTPQPASTIRLRLLPSMTDLAFLMPLVFLFAGMQGTHTMLGDGDTGWHLRTGQWILAHGRVPDHDIFSFTRSGAPWFAWEWLWDVLFGWIDLHAGMAAVLAANSLVLALTFALLFRLTRAASGDAPVALAITLIAAAGSAGHWLARPHLFTMLFTVIFYAVLEHGSPRRLWLLPPLMILWTNLHGGFVAGIVLILGYAIAEFAVLLRAVDAAERSAAVAHGVRYLVVAAVCAAATFVNPYFYHLHAHVAAYLGDSFYRQNVIEFESLNFQSAQARYVEILLVTGAAAAFLRLRQGRLAWPLLFAFWAHMGLYSARHLDIFVVLAAPPSAALIASVLRQASRARCAKWLRRRLADVADLTQDITVLDRGPRWHLASAAAILALTAALYSPRLPARFHPGYDPKSYPVAAAGVLERSGLFSGVFTQDVWGGYLIYRDYPRARVFMDGRSDFYGGTFASRYMADIAAQPGWEQSLTRYGVNTVLLPPDAPLAGALRQSSAWHLVYDDGVSVIFRPSPSAWPPSHAATGG
jgi:hypothetical protein